jgi:hypothetical protein
VLLLRSFNNPNIAHGTVAESLQSFLVSGTAVGSGRLSRRYRTPTFFRCNTSPAQSIAPPGIKSLRPDGVAAAPAKHGRRHAPH